MHAFFAVLKLVESEPELVLILEVINEIFTETHNWCFDSPDYILTWLRQLVLSCFHIVAVGKARGFDPKKEPNTLRTNFGY
jgi:hypothetical protein